MVDWKYVSRVLRKDMSWIDGVVEVRSRKVSQVTGVAACLLLLMLSACCSSGGERKLRMFPSRRCS